MQTEKVWQKYAFKNKNKKIRKITRYERQLEKIKVITLVHSWRLQPFSQNYGLVSHEWWDLQFKVDSDRQIFEQLFLGTFLLFSELLPEISWE